MEYTTNYHLPQWVKEDRIQMEDFNEAMASIEEGLSEAYNPDRLPYVVGKVTVPPDSASGTVLATFPFNPKLIIVGTYSVGLLLPNSTTYLNNGTVHDDSGRLITVSMSGNSLKLGTIGSKNTSDVTFKYAAFR